MQASRWFCSAMLTGIGLLLLCRCANPGALTGGPKDTIPPQVVKRIPPLGQTNFKSQEVSITFNEPVRSKNLQQELIITPRLQEKDAYEIIEKKYSIILRFKKPLLENTTYSIHFRNGIVDATEGNAAQEAMIVFSTGAQLDSLQVGGTCTQALSGESIENALVGLYPAHDSIDPALHEPLYLTKTNNKGQFRLQFVKAGSYQLFAIDDQNNNGKWDKTELLGFLPEALSLQNSIDSLYIELVPQDVKAPQIVGKRASGQYAYTVITFNEGIDSCHLQPALPFVLDKSGRILKLYHRDSLEVQITARDSTGNLLHDTLQLAAPQGKEKEKFEVDISESYQAYTQELQLKIHANKPIARQIDSLFYAYIDQDTLNKQLFARAYFQQPTPNRLVFKQKIDFRDSAKIFIDKGWLISIEEDSSQTQWSKKVNHANPKEFATLRLYIEKKEGERWIMQLLNKENKVIQEHEVRSEPIEMKGLPPGEYKLRFFQDSNANGRWDSGNYKEKILHEKIFIYNKALRLKANWEVEERLVIE
jgi:uncharacterized protein (DUF2141 family)